MKCIQVQLRLSAFLDGEVSPVETDEIKSHLAQCPDCRKIADEFSLVYNMISVWKPHQRNVSLKFVKPATSPRLDIFRWLAAAACFVGLFASGISKKQILSKQPLRLMKSSMPGIWMSSANGPGTRWKMFT